MEARRPRTACYKMVTSLTGSQVKPTRAAVFNPPDSLCVAACFDHSEGLWSAPVPEVELVVGGNQQELSSWMEGQGGNGDIALSKPALTTTLQRKHSLMLLQTNPSHAFCTDPVTSMQIHLSHHPTTVQR